MNFSGICVALITPYTENLSIDWEAFEKYVDWMCAQGVQGVVVGGTTGEGMALTPKEHQDLTQCAVHVCQKRAHVMAGCAGVTISQTLSLVEGSQKQGAESALVVTPPYIKPSQSGLVSYYKEIHAHSSLPLILYNNPSRTCVNLEVSTLFELAECERIRGIKDSTPDLSRPLALSELVKEKKWALFSGEDSTFFPFLASGGNGIISVAAGLFPHPYIEVLRCINQNDLKQAREIALSLVSLHQALGQGVNPGPIKYACHLMGLAHPYMRFPLGSLSQETQRLIESVVSSCRLGSIAV